MVCFLPTPAWQTPRIRLMDCPGLTNDDGRSGNGGVCKFRDDASGDLLARPCSQGNALVLCRPPLL